MKLIFKIARTELKNLFYSPVAWVLFAVFIIVCAVYYVLPIERFAIIQDTLLAAAPSFKGFDISFTGALIVNSGSDSLFSNVIGNLYLFIPLLTMGIISREFNKGTFKLLYSAPVKINQIVLGKYLAILLYNMFLSLIVFAFMFAAARTIKDIDYGHMLAGLVAFYLIVCTYTAIGLFMSSITNYQIVSALATFILLFVLQWIGHLWQDIDFVRELTYFLSISGRADRMQAGLLTTKDIMYYLLISILFITFTILKLKHNRENVSGTKKAFRFCAVFLMILVVGYLSSRPGYIGYWDTTKNKENTISENTQAIMKNFDPSEEVEVTLFSNLLDKGKGFEASKPRNRNHYVWNVWDPFVRFNPNLKFKYVLYYDIMDGDSSLYKLMPGLSLEAIAKEMATLNKMNLSQFLKPAEIRAMIDFKEEDYRSIMQLKYKGKSIFLRIYDGEGYWPHENHFAAAFKRLTTDSIPKVYFSSGNLERSIYLKGDRYYDQHATNKLHRPALINHGFELDTLNLHTQEIPADAHSIVVGDPKIALSSIAQAKIHQHISTGGNLLVVTEPGKQDIVNPLIAQTGITVLSGTLVQLSQNETPDKTTPYLSKDYSWLIAPESPMMKIARSGFDNGNVVTAMHPGVAPVSYENKGFQLNRMWVTHPQHKVWVKQGHLVADSAPPVLDTRAGDYLLDSFNVAVAVERQVSNKQQKIVVVGDADFLSNRRRETHFTGIDYLSWMSNETFPIRIFKDPNTDTLLTIGADNAALQKILFIWILPGMVIAIGTILIIRRKRL